MRREGRGERDCASGSAQKVRRRSEFVCGGDKSPPYKDGTRSACAPRSQRSIGARLGWYLTGGGIPMKKFPGSGGKNRDLFGIPRTNFRLSLNLLFALMSLSPARTQPFADSLPVPT